MEWRTEQRGGVAHLLLSHGAQLATDHNLKSIAFPAISSGIYRFPANIAARIAVGTVAAEIGRAAASLEQVVFCCFAPESAKHHCDAFAELGLA